MYNHFELIETEVAFFLICFLILRLDFSVSLKYCWSINGSWMFLNISKIIHFMFERRNFIAYNVFLPDFLFHRCPTMRYIQDSFLFSIRLYINCFKIYSNFNLMLLIRVSPFLRSKAMRAFIWKHFIKVEGCIKRIHLIIGFHVTWYDFFIYFIKFEFARGLLLTIFLDVKVIKIRTIV